MIEIPEAVTLANQLNETIWGKRIASVIAAHSPHKFAWFSDEPDEYDALLSGHEIGQTFAYGGRVEVECSDMILHFGEGVNLRYYEQGVKLPAKHQLLIKFVDQTALIATVAMYGVIWCCKKGMMDDFYSTAAREKVSPLSDAFDYDYFLSLFDEDVHKMSAKAFLATNQRIPGVGNGVVHDILLNAKLHPKQKMGKISDVQIESLFKSLKSTLQEMTALGGRDTQQDLFGNPGGYETKLSKNNKTFSCPNCGGKVHKENYLGGSIYYCEVCQEIV